MTANSKILKQKSYKQISFKIKKEIANKSINNDFCVFVSKEITQLCERLNESSEYVFTAVWSLGTQIVNNISLFFFNTTNVLNSSWLILKTRRIKITLVLII